MNSHSTQYHPYEHTMPRDQYRELMRRSCIPPQPRRRTRFERFEQATGNGMMELLEMAELVVFAGGMLALLAYGLMWSLN